MGDQPGSAPDEKAKQEVTAPWLQRFYENNFENTDIIGEGTFGFDSLRGFRSCLTLLVAKYTKPGT